MTTVSETLPAMEQPPRNEIVLRGLRVGWLNALVIGATILVWLTIIGSVIIGIAVAAEQNDAADPAFELPVSNPGEVPEGSECAYGQHVNSLGVCVN